MNKHIQNQKETIRTPELFLLKFLMVFLIFGQRLCIPLVNNYQVPLILFVVYLVLIILLLLKKLSIDLKKFWLFFVSIDMIFATALVQSDFALTSLVYLILTYFPFSFMLKNSKRKIFFDILSFYQKLMVIASLIGILQFLLQFMGLSYKDWLTEFLSPNIILKGYNTSYPIEYGSSIYKSNGIFFLEPSYFSQYLAIAILIDVFFFKKVGRVLIYLLALIFSFSGTGLLILAFFGLPVIFIRMKKIKMFFLILGIIVFTYLISSTPYAQIILQRLGEFRSFDGNSSAYIRFIYPYETMFNFWNEDISLFFTGVGIGLSEKLNTLSGDFATPAKLMVEYGFITGSIFLVFLTYCFYSKSQSIMLSNIMFFMYLFLSASLLTPHIVYLCYVLIILIPYKKEIVLQNYSKNSNLHISMYNFYMQ